LHHFARMRKVAGIQMTDSAPTIPHNAKQETLKASEHGLAADVNPLLYFNGSSVRSANILPRMSVVVCLSVTKWSFVYATER